MQNIRGSICGAWCLSPSSTPTVARVPQHFSSRSRSVVQSILAEHADLGRKFRLFAVVERPSRKAGNIECETVPLQALHNLRFFRTSGAQETARRTSIDGSNCKVARDCHASAAGTCYEDISPRQFSQRTTLLQPPRAVAMKSICRHSEGSILQLRPTRGTHAIDKRQVMAEAPPESNAMYPHRLARA